MSFAISALVDDRYRACKRDHCAKDIRVERPCPRSHEGVSARRLLGIPRFFGLQQSNTTGELPMVVASRWLATVLWRARFASGLLRLGCTTSRDTTPWSIM